MALGAAQLGGETGHAVWVEQRDIGRGQVVGDHHGAVGQVGEGAVRRTGQVADQPLRDLAHVVDAARQIGIVHAGEGLGDGGELGADRRLGIDPLRGDAVARAAHQARAGKHFDVRVEQVSEFLAGGRGQAARLAAEAGDLFPRRVHRGREAVLLGANGARGDAVFRHLDRAGFDHVRRADGDAARHADAFQDVFGARRTPCAPPALSPHRSRRRPGRRGRPAPRPLGRRAPPGRGPSHRPRPASSVP